jgi:hypothetical protein
MLKKIEEKKINRHFLGLTATEFRVGQKKRKNPCANTHGNREGIDKKKMKSLQHTGVQWSFYNSVSLR